MGHPIEIFLSPPPDGCTCAICHDVLLDAVAMKECGHTFCDGCARACMSTKSCPNCRVTVTGSIPNFFARDTVGSMQVKCPHGNCDAEDGNGKRRKGNGGETVNEECCTWTGRCEDLKNHDSVCEFKTVTCEWDGCNHQCKRKDMDSHLLSGGGVLRHMNAMKQGYESKIQGMQQKIDSLERKVENMESSSPTAIRVENCGVEAINGVYRQNGETDGVPMWHKVGYWRNRQTRFTIYRKTTPRRGRCWLISVLRNYPHQTEAFHFYATRTNLSAGVPPVSNWSAVKHGPGVSPAPSVLVVGTRDDECRVS